MSWVVIESGREALFPRPIGDMFQVGMRASSDREQESAHASATSAKSPSGVDEDWCVGLDRLG